MKSNKLPIIILVLTFFAFACTSNSNQSSSSSDLGEKVDLDLYQTRDIPNTNWKHVERKDSDGKISEQGFMSNGVKTGTWTNYYPRDGQIQSIKNYFEGVLMGPYLEFDTHGRLNKQINYENNQMSGLLGEYQNGRLMKQIDYIDGKIHGYMREFNNKSIKIREAAFKNDVLDGEVNNYNDEGKLVLQYIYKNGDKVSGGIID